MKAAYFKWCEWVYSMGTNLIPFRWEITKKCCLADVHSIWHIKSISYSRYFIYKLISMIHCTLWVDRWDCKCMHWSPVVLCMNSKIIEYEKFWFERRSEVSLLVILMPRLYHWQQGNQQHNIVASVIGTEFNSYETHFTRSSKLISLILIFRLILWLDLG